MGKRTAVNKYRWTIDEDNFLKRNFYALTNQQLADKLGLKLTAVRRRCYDMGLKRMELEFWAPDQIEFLHKNYQKIGDTELASIYDEKWPKKKGWSKKHIEKKRRSLKLKRTPEQLKQIHKRNTENGMFSICAEKAWKDRRAKIGSIRIWKSNDSFRAFIKTKKGFTPYAPWLYRKEVGSIPKGMVVRVICEGPVPQSIKDLELITRAENAIRNKTDYDLLPEDLKETIKLKNKLIKKLK